jgi:hypothetical protein
MTEEQIRAIIAAAFTKAGADFREKVTENGIQLDTAMGYAADICEAVATEVGTVPTP